MIDVRNNPVALYNAIQAALISLPKRNLSTTKAWRELLVDTREAFSKIGVSLTDTQLYRLHTSDSILTLWDQIEYVFERHCSKNGLTVIWPSRGETLAVIPKSKKAC